MAEFLSFAVALQLTTGLCAGVALVFLSPVTAARLCTKDKCFEPMFGDASQARTNAAMLLMPIDTTSSRTCTKPTVMRRLFDPCYFTFYTPKLRTFRYKNNFGTKTSIDSSLRCLDKKSVRTIVNDFLKVNNIVVTKILLKPR